MARHAGRQHDRHRVARVLAVHQIEAGHEGADHGPLGRLLATTPRIARMLQARGHPRITLDPPSRALAPYLRSLPTRVATVTCREERA